MAEFNYMTRKVISDRLRESLERRIDRLSGHDKELAWEIAGYSRKDGKSWGVLGKIEKQFYAEEKKTPSQWFRQKGILPGKYMHQALFDVFVPKKYQESYLYIIDKLNQFPFSYGWSRRTVRTAGYGPSVRRAFSLLMSYEKLFYCGENLEDIIYRRFDEEKLDYIGSQWNFSQNFSLIYAAEIDRGNQAVISALEDLILSENNTAYLDREMILGILRSDHHKLHRLTGDLLLAARLQEGLRQVICEAMDEGTREAFMTLLQVVEENDLIRYSSVKRAVSTWIGIFDEGNVDRVNGKLLQLMGQCLRDKAFCAAQLKTNDSVAINAALWALGFEEAENAVDAMTELVDHGSKNQKLSASFYNGNLFDEQIMRKTARKVILEHTDDLELVAAFMPAYTVRLRSFIFDLLHKDTGSSEKLQRPETPVITDYFRDRKDAEEQYTKFWSIYRQLPKKGVLYDPCIFPWHYVELKPSEVVLLLAFTAYVLQDEEKITEMAAMLGEISAGNYSYDRGYLLNLLLYHPKNAAQRKLLIQYMGNAEESTSEKAVELVKKLSLGKEDFLLMEDMLRFKRGRLRRELLEFLMKQEDADMAECLKRLLTDKKEEKRIAGLDLLLRLSKKEEKTEFYHNVKGLAAGILNPTDKEKLLLKEILDQEESSTNRSDKRGYGIYNPDAPVQIPEGEEGRSAVLKCISLSEEEIIKKIKKLDALIQENRDYEYEAAYGGKELLGNCYKPQKKADRTGLYCLENFPLEEKFRAFYEEEIKDYAVFIEWEARLLLFNEEVYRNSKKFYQAVFGREPFAPKLFALDYETQVRAVRLNYRYEYMDRKLLLQAGLEAASALLTVIDSENKKVEYHYTSWNNSSTLASVPVKDLRFLDRFLEGLGYWDTDTEFQKAFYAAWKLELKCSRETEKSRFYSDMNRYNSLNMQPITPIAPYWFLKAYHMELISWDILLKALLEYFNRKNCLRALTQFVKEEFAKPFNTALWKQFFGENMGEKILRQAEDLTGRESWCRKLIRKLYDSIVPVMVDTELRRGEAETVFSEDIGGITYIEGIGYLVRILMALGKDTLGRETYYSWYYSAVYTKKEVLSLLLKACYPAKGDDAKALGKALSQANISAQRLVEVAMYAPQWMDIIQEYLGLEGLKSGCYYFMAHMDERFDDQKLAMIAKYTPLSGEELQGGAFDIDWFQEAYGKLGEKNFSMLYKAEKYISDGQKHSRARKYADAASGKISLQELEDQIEEKRNKDLLMSYGLVPFGRDREKDILNRYQFIRKFAKESKQFGAQRRASESAAAQTALVNLSVHAGFADVTRLTLNMESRLAGEFASYMEWTAVEDIEIRLQVDEMGKSAVLCRKGEKILKSVPSRIGKNGYVVEVKEAHKKLKEQYIRTKKLMEESMEDGAEFTASEAAGLMGNPVVQAILKPLVFISGKTSGFLSCEESAACGTVGIRLVSWDGSGRQLPEEQKIRIAHPLDLYRAGVWHSYQKYLFERKIRQPFKQVFRELYVKLPEELGLKSSRMFAGNQIQPKKTVGCLKGRRWIADYEEGLQKVYYKENVIARIYALADWFTPSDVEAPTLEWVEFSDRKTFEPLCIEQVPDLIYSEVMRDVDLAVSVAHAGGVDPETSHSTIEMRRAIIEFNLPLFQLDNVILKESHALIRGTRGNYNVHLGSGVVHQEGGAMLYILPVHSQHRGKLFLPFVDEDPKTAEIMSKIVFLAEDGKIKDPSILNQIH